MIGIISYGAYIPMWRMERGEIAKVSGMPSAGGERSVASWDEDSLTIGVEAGLDCLDGFNPKEVDALYFATMTSPFKEKQASAMIATALDLRSDIFICDITNSARSGIMSLKMAVDSVSSGSIKKALVIISDCRSAAARSENEQMIGHAACAFLVGGENIIASIDNFFSVTDFVPGAWQTEQNEYPRTFESKLDRGYGLLRDVPFVVSNLLKKSNLELKDISKFCLYSPDPRGYLDLGKTLGIDLIKQLENPLFESLGMTGTPHATLLLISSLMQAKPGMNIVCASWGDGATACLIKITDNINKLTGRHLGISYLNSKRKFPFYGHFAEYNQAREYGWGNAGRSSVVGYWRDLKWGVQLYGMKCNKCQTLQYPITRACVKCGEIDNHQEVRLSRRGKVFTFTHDYLAGPFGAPTLGRYPCTRVIVDLEDGCRVFIELMDSIISEVEIGMPVELTFRMLHEQKDSFRYYGWRARPVRN